MLTSVRLTPLTEDEFDELIFSGELLCVLYISSERCKVSTASSQEFTKLVRLFQSSVPIFEVDAERERGLVQHLDVKAAPALLIFDAGVERGALLGFHRANELGKKLWSIISTEGDV